MSTPSLDEVTRNLKKLSQKVAEILQLHRITQDQMVTAGMHLEIRMDDAKNSPRVREGDSEKVNIKNIEALRRKYKVLRELFHTKTELEAMDASLRVNFAKDLPEKALRELEKLKKDVIKGINEAFNFLRDVSAEHMPRKLELLSKGVSSAIEKSLLYKKATLFHYVFEVDGELCFTYYFQLLNVEDETGKMFPELYLTMTQRLGANPGFYVGLQHHFTPPSEDLLMKRVKDIKGALAAFSTLMELDSFDNTLGSLPLELLLNPKSIVKDLFSYKANIRSVDVDEHSITFNLNANAAEKAGEIASQLYKELTAVQRRTNARLRMSIERGKAPKVLFKFVPSKEAPPVQPGDLEFLKLRFGVDDVALSKISRIINLG
jgi:hypothetical protein